MTNKLLLYGGIALGVFFLIGIVFFAIYFNVFNNIVGTIGNNGVTYVSEDLNTITYKITSSNENGQMFPNGIDGIIGSATGSLSFGETLSSDVIARSDNVPADFGYGFTPYPRDMQTLNYKIKNVQFNGLSAYVDFGSDRQRYISDIRVVDWKGYCRPVPAYKVSNIDCGRFDGQGRCSIAQGFECFLTGGKLKAFENNQEVSATFVGLSSVTLEVETLKQGVQCTQNQLVLCGEGNFECLNNQCVEKLVISKDCSDLYTCDGGIRVSPCSTDSERLLTLEEACQSFFKVFNYTQTITLEEQNLVLEEFEKTNHTLPLEINIKAISEVTKINEEKVKFILEENVGFTSKEKSKPNYFLIFGIAGISFLVLIIIIISVILMVRRR